jgi:hypothetical protein
MNTAQLIVKAYQDSSKNITKGSMTTPKKTIYNVISMNQKTNYTKYHEINISYLYLIT